jgi:hypothetical protein
MILSSSIRAARQARVRETFLARVTLSAAAADLPLVQIAALPDPELVKAAQSLFALGWVDHRCGRGYDRSAVTKDEVFLLTLNDPASLNRV